MTAHLGIITCDIGGGKIGYFLSIVGPAEYNAYTIVAKMALFTSSRQSPLVVFFSASHMRDNKKAYEKRNTNETNDMYVYYYIIYKRMICMYVII